MSRRKDTSVTDEYNKQKELEQLHRVFNRLGERRLPSLGSPPR